MSLFAQPSASGDSFKPADHEGALLLIVPEGIEEGIETVHGAASAVRARVTVINADGTGERFDDSLIFARVLQSQLKRIGVPVLGRLGRGAAKPGKSAPYQLEPFSPEDAKAAETYLAANPSFTAAQDSENIPF